MKRAALLVLATGARSTFAAEVAAPAPGLTSGLGQAVLGLAVVLALIWGAAWLMRRVQPRFGASPGILKIVGSQSVGQRERVVVIEVAEQWLVVGVAPGNVSALATLPKGVTPATPVPAATFAGLLARARGEPK